MGNAPKTTSLICASQVLFFLNAVIWSILGVMSLLRLNKANPGFVITAAIIAIMMFGNAGAMLVSGIGLGKQRRFWFYLALTVLAVNIVLTFTDEFGLPDLITLLIDLVLLGILIVTRKQYSQGSGGISKL